MYAKKRYAACESISAFEQHDLITALDVKGTQSVLSTYFSGDMANVHMAVTPKGAYDSTYRFRFSVKGNEFFIDDRPSTEFEFLFALEGMQPGSLELEAVNAITRNEKHFAAFLNDEAQMAFKATVNVSYGMTLQTIISLIEEGFRLARQYSTITASSALTVH